MWTLLRVIFFFSFNVSGHKFSFFHILLGFGGVVILFVFYGFGYKLDLSYNVATLKLIPHYFLF